MMKNRLDNRTDHHHHQQQQQHGDDTAKRHCRKHSAGDVDIGRQAGEDPMTTKTTTTTSTEHDSRWVKSALPAALSLRSSVTLHLKGYPYLSSTETTATKETKTMDANPIIPTAATATREEADRRLAESLYVQELVLQQQQQQQQQQRGTPSLPSSFSSAVAGSSLDQAILTLECNFLPVLELVWPEVYWLTEQDMGYFAEQEQRQQQSTVAAAANSHASSSSTATEIENSSNENGEHLASTTFVAATATTRYKQGLYQQLVQQGTAADAAVEDVRDGIRDNGPLPLLEYLWCYPKHDVTTMEGLTVFASSLQSMKKDTITIKRARKGVGRGECDDDSWKALPCWDSPNRLYTFQRVCEAIGFLGEQDFVDTVFVATTGMSDDDGPEQILDYVERRCKEEADEIFEEVRDNLSPVSENIRRTGTSHPQRDDADASFENDLQMAIALSLTSTPSQPLVDADSSSCGEKRKWTSTAQEKHDDGGDDDDDQKMGAVRDQRKNKAFLLPYS